MKQEEVGFDYVSEVPEESLGEEYEKDNNKEKKIELKTFHGSMESLSGFFDKNEDLRNTTHNEINLNSEERIAWQSFMDMMPRNEIHSDGDKSYVATRFGVPEVDVVSEKIINDQLLYNVQLPGTLAEDKRPIQRTKTGVKKNDPFLKEVTPESMKQLVDLLGHNLDSDKESISTDKRKLDDIFESFSCAQNADRLEQATMNMRRILRYYNDLNNVNIISVEVATAIHNIKCSLALIVDLMVEMKEFYEKLPKEGDDLNDKRDPLIKKFGRRFYLSMSTAETALNVLALECEKAKTKISEIESVLVGKRQ